MEKWPTLAALAEATEADVHTAWAGLGYYSRGTRLWKGAQKVVGELGGCMPRTAAALQKQLPGVGPYTAAAIASIAFNERSGVVDGNVIRVFARLRAIGADSASDAAMKFFWRLSGELVDPARPGDFNQALMELGATCCTPKSPSCDQCPVAAHCVARREAVLGAAKAGDEAKVAAVSAAGQQAADSGGACSLCLPSSEAAALAQADDSYPSVTIYPRKRKKAPVPEQKVAVLLCQRPAAAAGASGSKGASGPAEAATPATREPSFLLTRRPANGLMPNLWTFPLHILDAASDGDAAEVRPRSVRCGSSSFRPVAPPLWRMLPFPPRNNNIWPVRSRRRCKYQNWRRRCRRACALLERRSTCFPTCGTCTACSSRSCPTTTRPWRGRTVCQRTARGAVWARLVLGSEQESDATVDSSHDATL